MKVLVVDDDPTSRLIVSETLIAIGFSDVLTAVDGGEAKRVVMAHGREIGLISCDCQMPEIDGIEFIEFLGGRKSRCPIILVSGAHKSVRDGASGLARANGLNVIGSVRKPIDVVEIGEITRHLVPTSPWRQFTRLFEGVGA